MIGLAVLCALLLAALIYERHSARKEVADTTRLFERIVSAQIEAASSERREILDRIQAPAEAVARSLSNGESQLEISPADAGPWTVPPDED